MNLMQYEDTSRWDAPPAHWPEDLAAERFRLKWNKLHAKPGFTQSLQRGLDSVMASYANPLPPPPQERSDQ